MEVLMPNLQAVCLDFDFFFAPLNNHVLTHLSGMITGYQRGSSTPQRENNPLIRLSSRSSPFFALFFVHAMLGTVIAVIEQSSQ